MIYFNTQTVVCLPCGRTVKTELLCIAVTKLSAVVPYICSARLKTT